MDKHPTWTEAVSSGVRSKTPTLVELVDPQSRWLAVAAASREARSTWLVVPDREVDGTLRELAAHLPDLEVRTGGDGPGTHLVAESWFFDHVATSWVTRVTEPLPNAMVILRGDGFVERARDALTRTVRDRRIVADVVRRVRVGRLLGSTAVLPADVVEDLQARPGIPIVNDDPNWVAYLEQELTGPTLKSRPVEVGPMLRYTFAGRAVVVLGEALAVDGSMDFTAGELGLDGGIEVCDEASWWDELTLFTPPMPETSSTGRCYAVAEAAWLAIRSREGRALVLGSAMNRQAIQRCIRRPERVMGELGAGVTFAGPDALDRLGSFPLIVVDALPFPNTLDPVEAVLRHRQVRWFEHRGLPKAIQRFRRAARLVEPGGTLVVLDHRVHSRAYGHRFVDALACVHITDWEGFLPTLDVDFAGGAR
ncbi:MAG: hypothetical protein R3F61_35680 [Myxococcota bacterium]